MPHVFVLPFAAALVAGGFAAGVLRHFRGRGRSYHLVWAGALGLFAVAALAEGIAGIWGWSPVVYRVYYLCGGLLSVGWLGVGSLLLVFPRRLGPIAAWVMLTLTLVSAVAVALAPIDAALLHEAEPGRGTIGAPASVLAPITNTLGLAALVGVALASGWGAWRHRAPGTRILGVLAIGLGALVAGVVHGLLGQVTGHHELAPVGELVGVTLMFIGYAVVEARLRSPVPSHSAA
jgi:hypothetical protein